MASDAEQSDNRSAFREIPTYGQFMALQMFVAMLSRHLYEQNPSAMEELVKQVDSMNSSKPFVDISPPSLSDRR